MKSMTLNLLTGLLLASASSATLAMDESACRDGYSTMLLTQNECKTWISTHASLEKRGDNTALKQLDERMRNLMAERAETCPCAWDHALKEKMLQKNAGF
ncbi:MAG: hypothetical protein WBK19_02975 [Azonexus sp.]